MREALRDKMEEWLTSDDPLKRKHAAARLAMPDPPIQAYPPLATQARNLAGSLSAWARAGLPIAPPGERRRRRSICLECPLFDPEQRRCLKCGCSIAVKPWLRTARCPEGKW